MRSTRLHPRKSFTDPIDSDSDDDGFSDSLENDVGVVNDTASTPHADWIAGVLSFLTAMPVTPAK